MPRFVVVLQVSNGWYGPYAARGKGSTKWMQRQMRECRSDGCFFKAYAVCEKWLSCHKFEEPHSWKGSLLRQRMMAGDGEDLRLNATREQSGKRMLGWKVKVL